MKRIFNYLKERETFPALAEMIILHTNEVHIEQFHKLLYFSSEKIVIAYRRGVVTIKGRKLYIQQLWMESIIIEGIIVQIDFSAK